MVRGDISLWLGLSVEIVSVMNWREAICWAEESLVVNIGESPLKGVSCSSLFQVPGL